MKITNKMFTIFFSVLLFLFSFSLTFASPYSHPNTHSQLTLTTTSDHVTPNSTFSVQAHLNSVQETVYSSVYSDVYGHGQAIYAEDFTLDYDSYSFEFVNAYPATEGLRILYMDCNDPGRVRFIVISEGERYGVYNDTPLIDLTFRAKGNYSEGRIDPTSSLIANGFGEEFDTALQGIQISVFNGSTDVNRDGRTSLGDLAIDARHYYKASHLWDERFDVDVVKDYEVNHLDLKAIVNSILNNEYQ